MKPNLTKVLHDTFNGSIHRIKRSVWIDFMQFRDVKGRFTNRTRRGHLRVLEYEKKLTKVSDMIAENVSKNNALLARFQGKF